MFLNLSFNGIRDEEGDVPEVCKLENILKLNGQLWPRTAHEGLGIENYGTKL